MHLTAVLTNTKLQTLVDSRPICLFFVTVLVFAGISHYVIMPKIGRINWSTSSLQFNIYFVLHFPAIVAVSVYLPCRSISIVSFCLFVCLRFLNDTIVTFHLIPKQCVSQSMCRNYSKWVRTGCTSHSCTHFFLFHFFFHSLLIVPLLILLVLSLYMFFPSFLFDVISHYLYPFSWEHSSVFHLPSPTLYLPCNHNRVLFLPSCFSCDRFPVSSSLLRGKAVNPSLLHWPIESYWAPILLLIGWAGLSRYWEEELALLAFWFSAYLSVCLHDLLCLCSRADLNSVSFMTSIIQNMRLSY